MDNIICLDKDFIAGLSDNFTAKLHRHPVLEIYSSCACHSRVAVEDSITSDGRKLGLDPRLIDPSFEDNPDTKLNRCVDNVARIYSETAEDKLPQIIFCDLGVPHKTAAEGTIDGEDADDAKDKKSMAEVESLEECDFCVYDDIRDIGQIL